VDGRRLLWVGVVIGFLVLAVAGPVAMLRANRPAEQAQAAGAGGGGGGGGGGGAAAAPVVRMENIAFVPATLTVDRGTEVLFENKDVAPHTVTAQAAQIDSGTLGSGKSFRLVVNQPLDYICTIHPSMTAKILLSG
jgi:plastocyanin